MFTKTSTAFEYLVKSIVYFEFITENFIYHNFLHNKCSEICYKIKKIINDKFSQFGIDIKIETGYFIVDDTRIEKFLKSDIQNKDIIKNIQNKKIKHNWMKVSIKSEANDDGSVSLLEFEIDPTYIQFFPNMKKEDWDYEDAKKIVNIFCVSEQS